MPPDLSQRLAEISDWLFDFSQPTQKLLWAAIALLVGYLGGVLLARLLTFTGRRLAGLAHLKNSGKESSAEHLMFDILGSVVRALFLVAGIVVAADIIGLFHIAHAQDLALATAKGLAIFVAVWFAGSWIGSRVRRFGDRIARQTHAGSATLFAFLSSLVRFGALAVGLIAALQQFGFPIASLVAVVGAAGLAVALALQDTLKAVAAGVIIAVFRPYRIGDIVRIAGQDGTVADITPFTTVLNTIDNREIVITNDKAWGDVIINSSARGLRRLDLAFSIDYEDDIDKAIGIIRSILSADDRVRQDPPLWVKVTDLADSSVNLRARAWCANGDWWDLRCDMLKAVKQAFDANGISIPYPHQTQVMKHPEQFGIAIAPTASAPAATGADAPG